MAEPQVLLLLKAAAVGLELFCLNRIRLAETSSRSTHTLLLLYFGVLLQGDLGQILTQGYLFPGGLDQPAIIFSKIAYRFFLVVFVALVFTAVGPPWWRVLLRKETWLGGAIVAPFIGYFTMALWVKRADISPLMIGSELILYLCTLVAFGLGVFVLSRSHATRWARLAAGLLIACVAALGKRYQAYIGVEPANVFYELMWSIGLALQATVVIRDAQEPEDLRSEAHGILETTKLSIIVCTFFSTMAILLLEAPSARTVQAVTLISVAGVILVVGIDRVFSRVRKLILKSLEDYFVTQEMPNERLELLPPEYQEVMHRILDHNVAMVKARERDKSKADAERQIRISQGQICSQVSHDIRSPLAALEMLLGGADMRQVSEESRNLARSAVSRISDIAFSLEQPREGTPTAKAETDAQPVLLASEILAAVAEKRVECRGNSNISIDSEIDAEAFGLFAQVSQCNLRRMLSNLFNNSVQAASAEGRIRVSLAVHPSRAGMCEIRVEDDGIGIPAELLPLVGVRGNSFGKEGGQGLGLSHSIETARAAGGDLQIQSKEGRGTEVKVSLPIVGVPQWFAADLKMEANAQVLVLDDDSAIHHVWHRKLLEGGDAAALKIVHCESFDKLFEGLADCDPRRQIVILSDYELIGSGCTGLDMVLEHNLESFTTLVTSHHNDLSVQRRCVANGIKVLPKQIVPYVAVNYVAPQNVEGPAAVLIDDDPLIRRAWQAAAAAAKVELRTFASPRAFLRTVGRYSPDVRIYVDSHLVKGLRGETFVEDLHLWGFKCLYMATGTPAQEFAHLPFLKGVLGKAPPFASGKPGPRAATRRPEVTAARPGAQSAATDLP